MYVNVNTIFNVNQKNSENRRAPVTKSGTNGTRSENTLVVF